ncbi:MAG: hypothetical protein LBB52_00565, partial [Desulfovibrio sp.]|nr:hypothetical protein [Desulfovibrio sp.]
FPGQKRSIFEADNAFPLTAQGPADTIFERPERIQNQCPAPFFDFAALSQLPSFRQVRTEFVGKLQLYYLTELIRRCDGNFARAQEISGLSRARLYEILKHNRLAI